MKASETAINPSLREQWPAIMRGLSLTFGLMGLVIGIAGNAYMIYAVIAMLSKVEPGSTIRPMGFAFALFFFGDIIRWFTSMFGVLCLVFAWKRWQYWLLGLACIASAMMMFPLASSTFHWMCEARGIILAPS